MYNCKNPPKGIIIDHETRGQSSGGKKPQKNRPKRAADISLVVTLSPSFSAGAWVHADIGMGPTLDLPWALLRSTLAQCHLASSSVNPWGGIRTHCVEGLAECERTSPAGPATTDRSSTCGLSTNVRPRKTGGRGDGKTGRQGDGETGRRVPYEGWIRTYSRTFSRNTGAMARKTR